MTAHKRPGHMYTRMSAILALMFTVTALGIIGILYYWWDYTYANTFEDYLIDDATDQDVLNRGIKNEWVLGVSAHSIDLVEAVCGDAVADRLLEKAVQQVEDARIYREQIDGRYFLYRIHVDTSGGERIYRYSIVKDIYHEHFPMMVQSMLAVAIVVFLITLFMVRRMTSRMAKTIAETSQSIQLMARDNSDETIDLDSIDDEDLLNLVKAYQTTKSQLDEQRSTQCSMLQYISHELKTPVMIIKSYADSAKEGIYPKGDLKSSLDVIERQTNRIQARVADLLMVTRMETGYSNESPTIIDLSEIIRSKCVSLGAINPDKSVELAIEDDLTLCGIASQLQVLIENLLINQFKYSKSRVSIRGQFEGNELIIDFSNDGQIIPLGDREVIFDPFVKGPSGGTGLGLAICKRVVALHDGSISILPDTVETTFEVRLPSFNPVDATHSSETTLT